MIQLYFTKLSDDWDDRRFNELLSLLPVKVQQEITWYTLPEDRWRALAGKILLSRLMKDNNDLFPFLPETIQCGAWGKPFIDSSIDFNISHSGNVVSCGLVETAKIGVDVEQVKPISFNDYTDYFTVAEWEYIKTSRDALRSFFRMWVRKESVLKVTGMGVHLPLLSIEVIEDEVDYEGVDYYLHDVLIDSQYLCCVACDKPGEKIELREISF